MTAFTRAAWRRLLTQRADLTLAEAETALNYPEGLLLGVIADPEDYFIGAQRLVYGGAFVGALAANFSEIALWNSSGIITAPSLMVVERFYSTRALQVLEAFATATNLVLSNATTQPRDTQWGLPTANRFGIGRVLGGQNVARQGLVIGDSVGPSAGVVAAYELRGPWVLAPQSGVGLGGSVVAQEVGITYATWREFDLVVRG